VVALGGDNPLNSLIALVALIVVGTLFGSF
jgi:hypothetical protein